METPTHTIAMDIIYLLYHYIPMIFSWYSNYSDMTLYPISKIATIYIYIYITLYIYNVIYKIDILSLYHYIWYISHLYIYIMSMVIAIYHWAPESLLGIIENMGSPAVNQLRLVPLFRKIHMAGHPLFNNTPLENPIFWIQKLMEHQWKTNAFLILNPMNPIERPMDSKHLS